MVDRGLQVLALLVRSGPGRTGPRPRAGPAVQIWRKACSARQVAGRRRPPAIARDCRVVRLATPCRRSVDNETAILGWHGAAPAFRDKSRPGGNPARGGEWKTLTGWRESWQGSRISSRPSAGIRSLEVDRSSEVQSGSTPCSSSLAANRSVLAFGFAGRCSVSACWRSFSGAGVRFQCAAIGFSLVHELLMGSKRLSIRSDDSQIVRSLSWLKPNSQVW